ncbi:MAG: tRNA guanosine(34) transglycosylase Tgt [Candidatus Binatia bacterium]
MVPLPLHNTRLQFTLETESSDSRARAATFQTLHGAVQTPIFMPVGTQATVKAQTVESLQATGARLILANTYHLLLRPGAEVFRKFGGIHGFMNWPGPVLTDSGGFQIFSLAHSRAMNEAGANFKSYVDGKSYLLSPESSIEMQQAIGSDIMMVLDQCIPATAAYPQAQAAMELTHRWAQRSLRARGDAPAGLFGIVQGAGHPELRKASAEFLRDLPFDGLAIGGLAVGETHAERYDLTALVTEQLPAHLPRYLMGVGTPIDILEAVHRGVDMFDCIIPTQLAQRGVAFTSHGKLQLRRTVHKLADDPVDALCDCQCCRVYSRAYLHHLIKSAEVLGWHLLGMHNLAFYHRLMKEMRERILAGDFAAYYREKRAELMRADEDNPTLPPKKNKVVQPARLGDYELHRSVHGFYSIRQISSGEIMHSVNAPSEESNQLYIEQSALAARLCNGTSGELVIWDVGLGAASNAMAALHCFESCYEMNRESGLRPLRLISFERDLDPLRLAAKNSGFLPHLRHGAPSRILSQGSWQHVSGLLHWQLLQGDFRDFIETAAIPDLIFYDPFSFITDAALWTGEIFARIFARCLAKPAELYTYSAATAVRVALLSAGFLVAQGVGTGPKSETTIAFNRAESAAQHPMAPPLLDHKWLARWRRSSAKFPATMASAAQAQFAAMIEGHRQFSTTG